MDPLGTPSTCRAARLRLSDDLALTGALCESEPALPRQIRLPSPLSAAGGRAGAVHPSSPSPSSSWAGCMSTSGSVHALGRHALRFAALLPRLVLPHAAVALFAAARHLLKHGAELDIGSCHTRPSVHSRTHGRSHSIGYGRMGNQPASAPCMISVVAAFIFVVHLLSRRLRARPELTPV